ncbi:MaoC family dehydratase [Paenibacillus sp. FSL F4-0243]|uniref:MaoC family dehydratase n=1 Tax=Paenibacillus sp. FSL F4-0243 TaxID=2954732 RepID=UPI0030D6ED5A
MMRKCITAEAIRQYAAASQDLAAIHLDEDAAAEAGFKRPIAHGMYLMGLAQSLYIEAHQAQWITQYDMKFHKPIEVDNVVIFDFSEDDCMVKVTLTTEAGNVIASGAFSVKEV